MPSLRTPGSPPPASRSLWPLAALVMLAVAGPVRAGETAATRQATVAIFPFADRTATPDVMDLLRPLIEAQAARRAERVISAAALRPVLRAHRIRSAAGIDAAQAGIIHAETGADFALLGSCDMAREADDPELILSARLLALPSARVVAAASAGACGSDFAGLFGIGRIDSLDALAPRVVARLFDELDRPRRSASGSPEAARVAIVPLGDLSGWLHAGEIASSALLAGLVHEGCDVVEPGVVSAIFMENGFVPRGEVDYRFLSLLAEQTGAGAVVTGTVQEFWPEQGSTPPHIELGVRLLDAREHRILLAEERARSGDDGLVVLGTGRTPSLAGVLDDMLRPLVRRVHDSTPR
jgi:hypothetical protein